MYAVDELLTAVYGALDGVVTGGIYINVPPGTAYPYTAIGDDNEQPDDLYNEEGSDVELTFDIWSDAPGVKEVNTIKEELDAALHRAGLTVTGARCWEVRRTFSITMRDENQDTGTLLRHGVVRYRFRMEPAA